VALTARLYGFHRWPLSPRLVMSLPGQRELREFVLKEGPAELTRHWRSQRHEKHAGWLTWIRRDGSGGVPEVAYKLYVSPRPTSVRDALRELVPELTRSRCFRFKVAYFSSRAETLRVADVVRERIGGMAAHGVPFTCPVDPAGILSWGVDPPHNPPGQGSWRTWLCSELAQAMTECVSGDRVAAARERLATLGIDPDRWEPPPGLWGRHGSD
jgi:hypothetical protein